MFKKDATPVISTFIIISIIYLCSLSLLQVCVVLVTFLEMIVFGNGLRIRNINRLAVGHWISDLLAQCFH